VAKVLAGQAEWLALGNLDARRDWGHARDYVEAMWLMLQQPDPDDYVVATGISHSVRELAATAFALVDMDWKRHVTVDEAYLRPAEVDEMRGNAGKAHARLGWQPRTGFKELIREMLAHDLLEAGLDPEAHIVDDASLDEQSSRLTYSAPNLNEAHQSGRQSRGSAAGW
jgi:GDPmannose 4,6-dehydratase